MDPVAVQLLHERVDALLREVREAARGETGLAPCWTVEQLAADGARCRALLPNLRPIPPDHQWSMVFQPHADRDPQQHVPAVLEFLGPAVAMRRTTWLDGVLDPALVARWLPHLPSQPTSAHLTAPEAVPGLERAFLELELAAVYPGRKSVLTDAPTTDDQARQLAERVQGMTWKAGDALYLREPVPYPATAETRLAVRRCFHTLRRKLNWDHVLLSHFPTSQAIW